LARNSPFDEPGSIEECSSSGSAANVQLNRICIRRLVGSFWILYRHMHCWGVKTVVSREEEEDEEEEEADCSIKLHHILAASDDFSKLSMHWDLMPSAKLNYVHDFRGLFNCVSQVLFDSVRLCSMLSTFVTRLSLQVIYFHNPQYERRMQERKRIEDVSKGKNDIEMVQVLAPIMQLHPEILVEHEDSAMPLFFLYKGKNEDAGKKWIWLVMGRIIYLCSPWRNGAGEEEGEGEEDGRTIYYHENIAVLLALYRRKVPQSIN
jgi:hypothetical protein